MRADLRRLHSPDVTDLSTFAPVDPSHFGVLVQAMVGPDDSSGEESFQFMYCSPSWLLAEAQQRGPIWGRGYLVGPAYDYRALLRVTTRLVAEADGQDWNSVANRIARPTLWEFEDYRAS